MRAASLLILCLLGACGASSGQNERGAPPTFVSINPCTDAMLAEVADPEQILAISHYSHDPRASSMSLAQARRFPATGGTVEEVLALDPDIVLAGNFLPPASRSALERLGVQVETFGVPVSLEENEEQIRRLGRLAGQEERGLALVARIGEALAETRHEGAPVEALLWQYGGVTSGEDTLVSAMLAHTGFASHSLARGLGQGAYLPLEEVLADPPQVILAAGSDRMLAHPALSWADGMAYERLDPALLYCGGASVIAMTRSLAEIRRGLK